MAKHVQNRHRAKQAQISDNQSAKSIIFLQPGIKKAVLPMLSGRAVRKSGSPYPRSVPPEKREKIAGLHLFLQRNKCLSYTGGVFI
jgi:hypothetical protein